MDTLFPDSYKHRIGGGMERQNARRKAVAATIAEIKQHLAGGVAVPSIERAKQSLMRLAAQAHLFPREDFPLPEDGAMERTFLIHEDENGANALYVNSGLPGQATRPHNHGGSWAIVVAVEGEELHRLYVPEGGTVRQAGELTVAPGAGVSLLPDGIHSIHAVSDRPLLHLHLYGMGFPHQGERMEYDLETGAALRFKLEDAFEIEDAR